MELEDNLNIIKNERGAIEISVYDKDPKFAAKMASETASLIGDIYLTPVKENNARLLDILRSEVESRYKMLDSLSHAVNTFKKEAQYNKNATAYFDDIKNIDVRLTNNIIEATETKEKYMSALRFYNTDMPAIFIVEPAVIPEKKSKPIRWIIVASTTFGAFVLISLAVILIELYNKSRIQQ
jgi:hypothetical protein